ncbi:MAG: hypothetical protein F6J93_27815 [Oscillatoria sp. SIO1A7]|nr:hypothetical protein [Oscillatoria sp. SIO1A7]
MKNRHLYPENWEEISLQVREESGWTCEHCGKPCRRPGQSWPEFCNWLLADVSEPWFEQLSDEVFDDEGGEWGFVDRPQRFALTVAHLNHNPADCSRENLKALCAPCHLRYDAGRHAKVRVENWAKRKREARERAGQLRLFEDNF